MAKWNLAKVKAGVKRNTLAKKVATLTKKVNILKPELKHYDATALATTINNNPTFAILPTRQIVNGTSDFGQRVGDKILQKQFKFRGDMYLAFGSPGQRVRFIAFIYKRNPDQVVSPFATVINLYLASATMDTVAAPLAFLEWDNNKSFMTLYDKTHIINGDDAALSKLKSVDFTVNIPKSCQQVAFSASTAAPTQNELYVCAISSSDTVTSINYNYRYTYVDP